MMDSCSRNQYAPVLGAGGDSVHEKKVTRAVTKRFLFATYKEQQLFLF
jgi:hypothetical protein